MNVPATFKKLDTAGKVIEEIPVLILTTTHSGMALAPQNGPVFYVAFGDKRQQVFVAWNIGQARSPLALA
jgi:hypothetical protein